MQERVIIYSSYLRLFALGGCWSQDSYRRKTFEKWGFDKTGESLQEKRLRHYP